MPTLRIQPQRRQPRRIQLRRLFILLTTALLLSACLPGGTRSPAQTPVLVWHFFPDAEIALLEEIVADFSDLNPDVYVILERAPEEVERFDEQINAGLGPDLLVGSAAQLAWEIEQGYWLDLAGEDLDLDPFLPQVIRALQWEDQLYAVPLTAVTQVLFYNTSRIETPAEDLDQLLADADNGHTIGLPFDASQTLWGVNAFGSQLIGADGSLHPDPAFQAWIEWTKAAQSQPSVFLDADILNLVNLFATSKLDYLIANSYFIGDLRDGLGEEQVGVALLPSGPNPTPGGPLTLEALTMSTSTANPDIVLDLMRHFTDVKAQRILARSGTGRIPVNRDVVIDSRIDPVSAMVQEQVNRALVLPFEVSSLDHPLYAAGDRVYVEILQNKTAAQDAGARWVEELSVELTAIEEETNAAYQADTQE